MDNHIHGVLRKPLVANQATLLMSQQRVNFLNIYKIMMMVILKFHLLSLLNLIKMEFMILQAIFQSGFMIIIQLKSQILQNNIQIILAHHMVYQSYQGL